MKASISVLKAFAKKCGRKKEVKALLNTSDRYLENFTPLHAAIFFGHTPIVTALLENKADIHATTANGITAFELAEAMGQKDVMALLNEKCHETKSMPALVNAKLPGNSVFKNGLTIFNSVTIKDSVQHENKFEQRLINN